MRLTSLRTRFILAYSTLIVVGFLGLAALAGQQISTVARRDFYTQIANEASLIAHGIEQPLIAYATGEMSEEDLRAILNEYQAEACCDISLITLSADGFRYEWRAEGLGAPEFQSANYGVIIVDRRANAEGEEWLYSAAPIVSRAGRVGFIQLSTPASDLDREIWSRWSTLGAGVLGIGLLSVVISTGLSVSLIRPLRQLRQSAQELSRGNLGHRISKPGADEVGDVARAFNNMADRVEAMLEEQRAFASNTSHELRTPLTTMRLRTEALRYDDSLDDATRQTYIAELDDELYRLSTIVQDLTLLSRFDAGRAETPTTTLDFTAFAEGFARKFQGGEVSLTLERPAEPILIEASLNHISILFRNLLENATKYTAAGGSVMWSLHVEGDEVVSVIRDTGVGIEREALPHIFERFYRADKAHSRRIAGSGLGLPLAKAIVEAYGGRIRVASAGSGQGTTVTVRLPVKGDAPR